MRILAIWIEHALDVPVQRSHHSHPRHHRRAAAVFAPLEGEFKRSS
jgi:hypothetical protein